MAAKVNIPDSREQVGLTVRSHECERTATATKKEPLVKNQIVAKQK